MEFLEQKNYQVIVVENGQVRQDLSRLTDSGLKIVRGSKEPPPSSYFRSQNPSFFSLMNQALFRDYLYLFVPDNVKIKDPVFVVQLFVSDKTNKYLSAIFPFLWVELGRGASMALSEMHMDAMGQTQGGFVNGRTFVHLRENAQFNYLNSQDRFYQDKSSQNKSYQNNTQDKPYQDKTISYSYSKVEVYLERSSNLQFFGLTLGGGWTRQELEVYHQQEGASSQVHGLYLAKGKSQVENYVSIGHEKPHGISHQVYKGVLDEQAHGVFNGRIFIAPQSQKVDSSQLNKNLLLSDQAGVDTKPELEIHADDVRATHGTTVGNLSEEEMFYFVSRGISPPLATQWLVRGFINDLVGDIQIPAFRDWTFTRVKNCLEGWGLGKKN